MSSSRFYRQLISVLIVVSQVIFPCERAICEEPRMYDPNDLPPVVTDGGTSGVQLPFGPKSNAQVGDVIQDSRGIEWIVTSIDHLGGRPFYWLEVYRSPQMTMLLPALPDIEHLNTPIATPDLGAKLPVDWINKLNQLPQLPDLPNFDASKFSADLRRQMRGEAFTKWEADVDRFLEESTQNTTGTAAGDDTRKVPFPQLAPIPNRSIRPLRELYVQTIDRQLKNVIDRLGTVQSNVVAYTLDQIQGSGTDANWVCHECEGIKASPKFSTEARGSEQRASEDPAPAGSPYTPGAELSPSLIELQFTMSPGPERTELERIHAKLVEAAPMSPQGKTAKVIGLHAVVSADKAGAKGDHEGFNHYKEIAVAMADLAIGFTPLGTAKDAYEAISGHSLLDGHELTTFERSAAFFGAAVGALTLGAGAGVTKAAMKGTARLIKLARKTKLGAEAAERAAHLAVAAAKVGAKTKSDMRALVTSLARPLANEMGAVGEAVTEGILRRASKIGAKTAVGVQVFRRIESAIAKLPREFELKLIREGSDPEKIAIIGRSMGNADQGLVGVREVAATLKKEAGIEAKVFEPSELAADELQELLREYRKATGNAESLLPLDSLKKTRIWQENEEWAKLALKEGYTIIDSGNPNSLKTASEFYEMEKSIMLESRL